MISSPIKVVGGTEFQPKKERQGFRGREAVEITPVLIKAFATEQRSSSELYIADSVEQGLKLRKEPRNGRITFVYIGRVRGAEGTLKNKLKKFTFGVAYGKGSKSIAKARSWASEIRDQLKEGIDPTAERRVREAAAEAAESVRGRNAKARLWTVQYSLDQFLEYRATRAERKLKPKSASFYRESIGYLPTLQSLSVESLTVDMVTAAIDAVPTIATRSKAKRALSTVVNYGLGKLGSDKANPVERLARGTYAPPKARRTYLTAEKLPLFMESAFLIKDETDRDYVLLNLLCAPRKDELRLLKWDAVDFDKRCYSVADTKTGEGYMLPFTPWTEQIFKRRWNTRGKNPHVFPGDAGGASATVYKAMREAVAGTVNASYKFHDSRRTLATVCVELGITGERKKHLLHHKSSDITEGGYTQAVLETMRRDLSAYHEWLRNKHWWYGHGQAFPDAQEAAGSEESPAPEQYPGVR